MPRALARRLAEQSLATSSARQLLHGTCLYTDAENYTTVSEALRPEELMALMNDYFRTMFAVVERYAGEISDTAGDSMVAVWASARPDAGMRQRAAAGRPRLLGGRRRVQRAPTAVEVADESRPSSPASFCSATSGCASSAYEYRAIGDIVQHGATHSGH